MDPNGSRLPTVAPAARTSSTPDAKPRGANRSTKSTGKLQVLPDQPEPVAGPQPPSLVKPEPPKIKPPQAPPQTSGEDLTPESAGSTYTDEDEEETEEVEEQDAEVSTICKQYSINH